MKTFILASVLALTAVSGAVMISDPAKADFNHFSNGMFGHIYSPVPTYNPVLPLAGAAAPPQAAGFEGSDNGNASPTDAAAEAVQSLLDDGCGCDHE